jgi:iron(III) transport system substrate-binding protein
MSQRGGAVARAVMGVACSAALVVQVQSGAAQGVAGGASKPAESWIVPDLLASARAEGALLVYGSMNEQEALPLWKRFEEATGIKVNYVRSSDTAIWSRVAIENRARQHSWDVAVTTAVSTVPREFLQRFDPPEAGKLNPEAKDADRYWYGVYANYNTPAYNVNLVKQPDLPKSYEEFARHKEWKGKIAIDNTDYEWLSGLFAYYGEERARALVADIIANLDPVVVDGHLALARSVGSGEYWLALNNYASLTLNVKLGGAPTDFFALDPVSVFFGAVAMNAQAPHPKAGLLAANFLLSRETQQFLTRRGRLPTRPDVEPNPPGALDGIRKKKVVAAVLSPRDQKKWQARFKELFQHR